MFNFKNMYSHRFELYQRKRESKTIWIQKYFAESALYLSTQESKEEINHQSTNKRS